MKRLLLAAFGVTAAAAVLACLAACVIAGAWEERKRTNRREAACGT
jgi:hypothetical protein